MRLIHGLWNAAKLPEEDCYVGSWAKYNPSAKIRVWTLTEAEKLIHWLYPEFVETYEQMPFLVQRVNVARMVILETHGGIYLDLDMECLKPLDEFFGHRLFCRHPVGNMICNAIMGSGQGDPFWAKAIGRAMINNPRIATSTDGVGTTGSGLLTKLIFEESIPVLPSHYFFPAPNQAGLGYCTHHQKMHRWVGSQYLSDGSLVHNKPQL